MYLQALRGKNGMKICETTLSFLEEDCVQTFGKEAGRALAARAEEAYQELLRGADDRGCKAIRDHLQRKLFPPMAYYMGLRAQNMEEGAALEYVRQETRKAAQIKRAQMQAIARMPFAYAMYRLGVKKYMRKNFPAAGWQTEWARCDGQEIHFNLRSCLYWDESKAHGCPELCPVYCENDDISFSGLLPKIRFARTGTLAGGADCCDFHFIRA